MNRRELRKKLIASIEAEDLRAVKETIGHDASIVNAPNSHRNVPLQIAIGTGKLDLVKLLVEAGADIHHCNHGGRSMMDCAAYGKNKAIPRYLVSLGLEPTVHHLAGIGDLPQLRAMIAADPRLLKATDCGGRWKMTPLHASALGRCLETAEYLLSAGVEVNAINHHGHTALAVVVEFQDDADCFEIAELLLTHGAEANSSAGHHGGTILHRAILNGDMALTELLLENGADPNVKDWSGKTPLHHSISKAAKFAEMVLQYSPDVSVKSKNGETALDLARRLKKKAVTQMLESHL